MESLTTIIIIALSIIVYTYVGYPIILGILVKLNRKSRIIASESDNFFPEVTVIVAAWNEEKIIQEKIDNCLALNYPAKQLKFIFVTDGSDDTTPNIISKYKQILLFHNKERKGKTSAINRVMHFVQSPYVVFTDANAMLNPEAIKNLIRH